MDITQLFILCVCLYVVGAALARDKMQIISIGVGVIGCILCIYAHFQMSEMPDPILEEPVSVQTIISDKTAPDVTVSFNPFCPIYSFLIKNENGILISKKVNGNNVNLVFDDTNCVKWYKTTKEWGFLKEDTTIVELHVPENEVEYKRSTSHD